MTDDNGTLPWLKTSGNTIVKEDGQEVILRGANIMRAEWDNSMNWENRAIPELAVNWHGNVLTRGFASDPVNNGDTNYLGLLDDLVSLAQENRMYLILAWRSFGINGEQPGMPNNDTQNALATLAARYNGRSHVIYALQVEPHDDDEHGIPTPWATLHPLFESMVDSIRSAADPSHEPLVMIPGTNWSRDLSDAIDDPVDRTSVVYKTHPYGEMPSCAASSQFQGWFGKAHDAGLPVFVGEFGFVTTDGVCMTMSDVNDLLTFTRTRNIGWAAWILDFQATPLMNEADLSPTTPYGTTVQAEMLTTPPIPGETVTIDDSVQGTGLYQWQYQGTGWQHCIDCDEPPVTYYNASQSWTETMNDTAKLTFIGRQLQFFGVSAPWHGIAAVSIDGVAETMIDLYAGTKTGNALLWTSPLLAPGMHTFTLRATGDNNPASTRTVIVVDRVEIVV